MNTPLLPFPPGCIPGRLIHRIKRFSIAFEHEQKQLWAHTNNSGSMLGLLRQGLPIWVSPAPGKERKLPYTLEMINPGSPLPPMTHPSFNPLMKKLSSQTSGWVGVNTMAPNRLLKAAFFAGLLPFAHGYTEFKPEAKRDDSRLDALLTGSGKPPLWVECKNVTLVEDGVAAFPDAVTLRGQKHLRTMANIARNGERAAFFYCIQREDAHCFGPADYIDPEYARLFFNTLNKGVEAYPFQITTTLTGLSLGALLPLAPPP